MLPWYFLVPLLLLAFVLLVLAIGSRVAREHVATSTIELAASPALVWQRLADWRAMPSWRPELKSIEEYTAPDDRRGWREVSSFGPLTLVIEQSDPEHLLRSRIADDKLPFGGTWTHRLEPLPNGGTRLSSTEDGFIKPALFRFMARFLFGYHKTLNGYQQNLARSLGEAAVPVNS